MSDCEDRGGKGGLAERWDECGVQGAFGCDAIGALAVSRDVIELDFTGLGALSSYKGRRGFGMDEKSKVACRYIVSFKGVEQVHIWLKVAGVWTLA